MSNLDDVDIGGLISMNILDFIDGLLDHLNEVDNMTTNELFDMWFKTTVSRVANKEPMLMSLALLTGLGVVTLDGSNVTRGPNFDVSYSFYQSYEEV